jgi:hypothetical protein
MIIKFGNNLKYNFLNKFIKSEITFEIKLNNLTYFFF